MSKKDYIRFAEMLNKELDWAKRDPANARKYAVESIIRHTADIFEEANSRFDRERFYTACGLNS